MNKPLQLLANEVLNQTESSPVPEGIENILNHPDRASWHLTENDKKTLLCELEGFGPLEPLIQDEEVTEIIVQGPNDIYFESHGQMKRHPTCFLSDQTFNRFLSNIYTQLDKFASHRHPIVDGTLSGNLRVQVVASPISVIPCISLRKHKKSSMDLATLLNLEMFTRHQYEILSDWIQRRKNILISGATGSGKTTLLKALIKAVPKEERIITIEDTPELGPLCAPNLSLYTRIDPDHLVPEINLSRLIRTSLRLRPDRIVVGEVRGEEALYLLDAMATGHSGSMGTIHAGSCAQALRRLESLVSRAAPKWSENTIRQLIKDSFEGVVQIERRKGKRSVSSLSEIQGLESFGFLLNEID